MTVAENWRGLRDEPDSAPGAPMKLPNPWIGIPGFLAAVGGAMVGYLVTAASCAPDGCTVPAIGVGIATGMITATGVVVVAALALRSLAEHRDSLDRDILVFVDPDGDEGDSPATQGGGC